MNKEQLLELLKEGLTIELNESNDYYSTGIKAVIKFHGEVICSDYVATKHVGY